MNFLMKSILIWIQANNIILNRTTSERFGYNSNNNKNDDSKVKYFFLLYYLIFFFKKKKITSQTIKVTIKVAL